jgi:serine/threonine protein kinase
MPVSCPDFRQPVLVGPDNHPSPAKCLACGTAPGVRHDETLEYRPHEPPVPGHFQLLERVGMGAFGVVWKAHDKDLDRTVAVKVPRDGHLDTREAKRFLQEARTASQLKHPNSRSRRA